MDSVVSEVLGRGLVKSILRDMATRETAACHVSRVCPELSFSVALCPGIKMSKAPSSVFPRPPFPHVLWCLRLRPRP